MSAEPAHVRATDPAPADASLLSVERLSKAFPGVRALREVSLTVRRGEVHALVGENGAGKSTLVNVLCGAFRPDAGAMRLDDEPYAPATPHDALAAGVRVVHQELRLLDHMSVAENLTIEHLPRRWGIVDRAAMHARARALLEQVGLDVDTRARVGDLGIAQRQLLEIAKALGARSRLVILDEPTATLTPVERRSLFGILERLRRDGVSVLYISHHLAEVLEIGDRVTVLRNGAVVDTLPVAAVTTDDLVQRMVGRRVGSHGPGAPGDGPDASGGAELLRVDGLRVRGNPDPVSFAVRAGEVLGIAGLIGSGRTEVLRAIFGADARDSGRVLVGGREVALRGPADAVAAGIGLVTEDRKGQGLLLTMSGAANTSIAHLSVVTRHGLVDAAAEDRAAEGYRRELDIRTPSVRTPVGSLSGGNQQKFVLAKWLFRGAAVLLLDEPTRGVDVGAKFEIHQIIRELAAQGRAVVMVSSDLPELLAVSHRVVVLGRGRVTGELAREQFDEETVLGLAYAGYTTRAPDEERTP